jgi:hypothetical protein
MSKIVLIGYTIRIKEKRRPNYKSLRNFDGNSADFGVFLYDFLKSKSGNQNIEEIGDQKTIFYGDLGYHNNDKKYIKCKAYVGAFGNAYDIINFRTKNIDFIMQNEDSYAFPLNFIAYIPDLNSKYPDIGILVFEKYKNHGGKGLFDNQLKYYFSKKYNHLTLQIEPIVPEELIKYLEKGKITSTVISSLKIPDDLSDSYSRGTESKKKAKVELTIKNLDLNSDKRSLIVNMLRDRKHVKLSNLLTGYLIEPDEVKFSLEYEDHIKNIVLKEEGEIMTPGIDVTQQVGPILKRTGFPEDAKLYLAEYTYIDDIKESLNKDTS